MDLREGLTRERRGENNGDKYVPIVATPDTYEVAQVVPILDRKVYLKRVNGYLEVHPHSSNLQRDTSGPTRPLDLANIQLTSLGNSAAYYPIAILMHAARYDKYSKDMVGPFRPKVATDIRRMVTRVGELLNNSRYQVESQNYLRQHAIALRASFKSNSVDKPRAFSLCLSPASEVDEQRFGLFKSLFPAFHDQVLQYKLDEKQKRRIADYPIPVGRMDKMSYFVKALSEAMDREEPLLMQDLLLRALKIKKDHTPKNGDIVAIESILREAYQFVEWCREDRRPKSDKLKIEELQLQCELALLTAETPEEARIIASKIRSFDYRAQESREEPYMGIKIDPEKVQALKLNPELLVDPRDFGLKVDEQISNLIRRHLDDSVLDPEHQLSEDERTQAFQRIVYISVESLRANPEGFYAYQRALVLVIAKKLDERLLDASIPVPIPDYVQDKSAHSAFRQQEKLLKNNTDWHYLLLYKDIQDIFLDLLPYCGAPPIVQLELTGRNADLVEQRRYFFPWNIPRGTEEFYWQIVSEKNDFPCFNHIEPSQRGVRQRLSIPGLLVKDVAEAGGFLVTLSGITRAFFTGVNWDQVDQDDYVAFDESLADRIPFFDIDFHGFLVKGDIAALADRTVRRIFPRYGLFTARQRGLAMEGTDWTYISRRQVGQSPETSRADAPQTFITVVDAWMGRAVRQKTDLIVLGDLATIRMRTPGLIPEVRQIAGKLTTLVKPIDIFNGLTPLLRPKNKRMSMDVISELDVLPEKQLMSYWLLMRILSDTIWLRGKWDWNWLRSKVADFTVDWKAVDEREKELIRKEDLNRDAVKALNKAVRDNMPEALTLLGQDELTVQPDVEGVGFASFFPNLDRIRTHENGTWWIALWQESAYFARRYERYNKYGGSGIEKLAALVGGNPEIRQFIETDMGKKVSIDDIVQWLTRTIFLEPRVVTKKRKQRRKEKTKE